MVASQVNSHADTEGFDASAFVKGYHPYNPELQDDPYPLIDKLRAGCPVGWSEAMGGFWVVSRFEDCHFVLQRHDLFSSRQNTVPPARFTTLGPDIPMQIDPPEHGKYRTILNPGLSPTAVAAIEPQMRELTTRLIDDILAKGRCDFVADFAVPYPSVIFVRVMGLPEADIEMFLDWKDQILRTHEPEAVARVWDTVKVQLRDYFTAVYEARHAQADPGTDLIGRMIAAEFDGERPLTRDEFVGIACLVWGAGLDTVTAQLSLAIHYLATHPDRRDQIVADPTLIPGAIEELIRFDGLVNDCRVALADVDLGGQHIKAGDVVMALYGAAGRDPDQFANPYELDFTRFPNRHLGFGGGAHRCVGSHLARLELKVAMEEIHRRLPTYRIDPDEPPPTRHFGYVRGIDRLQLIVD